MFRFKKHIAQSQSTILVHVASDDDDCDGRVGVGGVGGVGGHGYAMKLADADLNALFDPLATERIALTRLKGHPYIIQISTQQPSTIVIEGMNYFCLTMDYAPNGDMLDYVLNNPMDDALSRTYFRQILEALQACHDAGVVCHRDIKLENILLDENFTMKLADFGLSVLIHDEISRRNVPAGNYKEPLISGLCGSPGYLAPEIINHSDLYLGSAADVWSAGCVLFGIVSGHSAFQMAAPDMRHTDDWLGTVLRGNYELFFARHFNGMKRLSPVLEDFIAKMLVGDPSSRASIPELLAHPWMLGPELSAEEVKEQMEARRKGLKLQKDQESAMAAAQDGLDDVDYSVLADLAGNMSLDEMESMAAAAKAAVTLPRSPPSPRTCPSDKVQGRGAGSFDPLCDVLADLAGNMSLDELDLPGSGERLNATSPTTATASATAAAITPAAAAAAAAAAAVTWNDDYRASPKSTDLSSSPHTTIATNINSNSRSSNSSHTSFNDNTDTSRSDNSSNERNHNGENGADQDDNRDSVVSITVSVLRSPSADPEMERELRMCLLSEDENDVPLMATTLTAHLLQPHAGPFEPVSSTQQPFESQKENEGTTNRPPSSSTTPAEASDTPQTCTMASKVDLEEHSERMRIFTGEGPPKPPPSAESTVLMVTPRSVMDRMSCKEQPASSVRSPVTSPGIPVVAASPCSLFDRTTGIENSPVSYPNSGPAIITPRSIIDRLSCKDSDPLPPFACCAKPLVTPRSLLDRISGTDPSLACASASSAGSSSLLVSPRDCSGKESELSVSGKKRGSLSSEGSLGLGDDDMAFYLDSFTTAEKRRRSGCIVEDEIEEALSGMLTAMPLSEDEEMRDGGENSNQQTTEIIC